MLLKNVYLCTVATGMPGMHWNALLRKTFTYFTAAMWRKTSTSMCNDIISSRIIHLLTQDKKENNKSCRDLKVFSL